MFTVCPKCALTLVVTAADLRAASGYVRCGRCANVFNAIAALIEDHAPPATQSAPPEPPPPAPPPQPAVPPPKPAADPEPSEADLEFDPVATNVSEIFVEPPKADTRATGTFETIVLETGEPDSALPQPQSVPPEATASPTTVRDDQDEQIEEELRALVHRLEVKESQTQHVQEPPTPAHENGPSVDLTEPPSPSGRTFLWATGAALLAVALLIQIVHHYRNDLAVDPRFNAPLARIYHALGATLQPHWDVHAYEVHQLGADAANEGTGRLIVRASVKNSAPHPQPLPLLRVSVVDRFGNRLATSDVVPASYLPRGVATNVLLKAGQRIDAEMSFVDPGAQATGFEIDACLAVRDGSVACANSH